MRNLFLALVLANLAFAAWHAWFAEAPGGVVVDPESLPLRLVSELDEGQREPEDNAAMGDRETPPRSAATENAPESSRAARGPGPTAGVSGLEVAPAITLPALDAADLPTTDNASTDARFTDPLLSTAENAADSRCVSVGPFAESSEAATVLIRLRAAGHESSQRDAEGEPLLDYWVHLQGVSSRAEANETVARLRENGVADAYLIPGEEDGDIVSLGVFRQSSRAGRLQEEVRQLGYAPVVGELTRRPTVYWVDIELEPGQEIDAEALRTPGRITRLEQQACTDLRP